MLRKVHDIISTKLFRCDIVKRQMKKYKESYVLTMFMSDRFHVIVPEDPCLLFSLNIRRGL